MKTLHSLGIVAALGLASTVHAQAQPQSDSTQGQPTSQSTTDNTAPSAASSPHQRSATSTTAPESPTTGSTEPGAASSQHQRDTVHDARVAEASHTGRMSGKQAQKIVGMKVEMASGESLGKVEEVLLDDKGAASYAVISHGNKRTAVPWSTVESIMENHRLIVDRSQLEQAPVLSGGSTPTRGDESAREADAYWGAKISTHKSSTSTGTTDVTGTASMSQDD
jgi:sporulation protein YlmC with PRC-barrel domain